jgi:hypothetical protein
MKFCIALLFLAMVSRLVAQPVVSESKFADVDHLKVHYTNYGKGESALVLFTAGRATKQFGASKRPRWPKKSA